MDIMESLRHLHEDRPDVCAKLMKAMTIMWEDAEEITNNYHPKNVVIDSLLTVLEYCGDYYIQSNIVRRLLLKEEVPIFKEWFSQVWFRDMPNTMQSFLAFDHLLPDAQEVRLFLNNFNSEKELRFIYSICCNAIYWNSVPLLPPKKDTFWLDLNCGTRSLTIRVHEVPSDLKVDGCMTDSIYISGSSVSRAVIYNITIPSDIHLQQLDISFDKGKVTALLHPLHASQWLLMEDYLIYLTNHKVRLEMQDNLIAYCSLKSNNNSENKSGFCAIQNSVSSSQDDGLKDFPLHSEMECSDLNENTHNPDLSIRPVSDVETDVSCHDSAAETCEGPTVPKPKGKKRRLEVSSSRRYTRSLTRVKPSPCHEDADNAVCDFKTPQEKVNEKRKHTPKTKNNHKRGSTLSRGARKRSPEEPDLEKRDTEETKAENSVTTSFHVEERSLGKGSEYSTLMVLYTSTAEDSSAANPTVPHPFNMPSTYTTSTADEDEASSANTTEMVVPHPLSMPSTLTPIRNLSDEGSQDGLQIIHEDFKAATTSPPHLASDTALCKTTPSMPPAIPLYTNTTAFVMASCQLSSTSGNNAKAEDEPPEGSAVNFHNNMRISCQIKKFPESDVMSTALCTIEDNAADNPAPMSCDAGKKTSLEVSTLEES